MSGSCQRPPLRVALMGLGRAMTDEHLPVFTAHPSLFKVVCACDLAKDRRDRLAKTFPDCRMFRQFASMLDESDVDLVDIATCSTDHVKHAIKSLKKGFWTLVETPLALTRDDAMVLKGAAVKAKNRLIVMNRGIFAPDFMLASQMMSDERLGHVHRIKIRAEDFVRRDDWQCIKRLGGGATYYAMPDILLQALRLLPSPPVQLWSELKRLASLGDAEDFAHVNFKCRDLVTADLEFNGGVLPINRTNSFEIHGERGVFTVAPGMSSGELRVVAPGFKFPRRRSSVRTPELGDLHEEVPVETIPVSLARGTESGPAAFWRKVYETVRTAAPFPISLDEQLEVVKLTHLMKTTSPFGK